MAYNHAYPFLFSSEVVSTDKKFLKPFHKKTFYNEAFLGMSYVYSTTADILKFDQALYDGKLLKTETLEEAFTPQKLNSGAIDKPPAGFGGLGVSSNGLGWFVLDDTSAGKIVWHGGGMPGILTVFLRNIEKKQTVVVLDNAFSAGLYRKGLSAMNILNGKPILPVKKSLARIYGRAIIAKGADYAAVRLNELKADTENYSLVENDFNNMAYEMMWNGYKQQALETFKINTFLFPASDNIYSSYGEGLLEIGKREEAITMFNKALKINPDNKDVKEALKKAESLK